MQTPSRRQLIAQALAFPLAAAMPTMGHPQSDPDGSQLRAGYSQRLKRILAAGNLPYIDIESSCNSGELDMDAVAKQMDRCNIGLMALSADIGKGAFGRGVRYDPLSARLRDAYPDRFIPVGNGGQPPLLTEVPGEFLDAQEQALQAGHILLLGEFEFRHYPSPRQVKRENAQERDVHVPIDGPTGHRLFRLSEKTGAAFQIHYEIEDNLLGPLESMLAQYPRARVIWCHLAQVRYIERASRYSPAYVESLIQRFPHVFFDTAFGNASSIYPLSNQRHARVWTTFGGLKSEWRDLMAAYPQRFLSALDLGGDRMEKMGSYDAEHRNFLSRLPADVQHQIAYRNAWRLLFGEEFT